MVSLKFPDILFSPNTTEPCRLNKTETLAYKDQNKIEFGKDVGGLKNPMVWHLRPMKVREYKNFGTLLIQ